MAEKNYYIYVLVDTQKDSFIYVGVTSNLRSRIKKHNQSKVFDGVLIVQKTEYKEMAYFGEKCIIKYLTLINSKCENAKYSTMQYDKMSSKSLLSKIIKGVYNG
jgi:hypothetical protein